MSSPRTVRACRARCATSSRTALARSGARVSSASRADDGSGGGVVHPRGQPQPRPASAHACRDGEHGARRRRPVERMRPSGAVGPSRCGICRLRVASARRAHFRLGLRWVEAPGLRAEVAACPRSLLGEFSSRSADIRRHMAEQGSHSARGARVAWAATRARKARRSRLRRAVVPVGTAGAVVGRVRAPRWPHLASRPVPRPASGRSTSIVSAPCCPSPPMARHVGGTWSPPSPPPPWVARTSTDWSS